MDYRPYVQGRTDNETKANLQKTAHLTRIAWNPLTRHHRRSPYNLLVIIKRTTWNPSANNKL